MLMHAQQNLSNKALLPYSPDVRLLESIFNKLFKHTEGTILCSGAEEPLYLPASDPGGFHTIFSTQDYFSSALHEISHWCIAGESRRKLVDYGYWYEPDGRTPEQQALFEQVEVKPQAMEWLFSKACGQIFRLSVDNIGQPEIKASNRFRENVHTQALNYLENGLPKNAELFLNSLLLYFQPENPMLCKCAFQLNSLN